MTQDPGAETSGGAGDAEQGAALGALASSERLLQLFNEQVLPQLSPGSRLRAVRPKRAQEGRGPGLQILCRLEAEPGPASRGLPPFATLRRPEGEEPPSPSLLALPELGVLVQLFPSDRWIPGLETAANPERMAPLLDRLTGAAEEGHPEPWGCAPLRYHPAMRCALLYQSGSPPVRRVVGKVFAKSKRARRAWSTLTALFQASTEAQLWRSPEPLHFEPELHLVLMEWLTGESMKERLVLSGEEEARRLVSLAARALVELHRPASESWELRTTQIDLAKLRRRIEQLAAVEPGLAERIGSLLDTLVERRRSFAPAPETLLHGSVSPNQLLVHDEKLSIVDLDGVRRGDPAIDVGTFMATLRKYRREDLGGHSPEALADQFLDTYREHRPEDDELADRARAIQCQELVNYAARGYLKRSSVLGPGAAAMEASRLLDTAAEAGLG